MISVVKLSHVAENCGSFTQEQQIEIAQELLYLRPHTTTPAAAPRFACVEVKISATEGEGL